LVNAKGERMEFEFPVTAERRDHEQAQAIIADYWKKVGVRTNIKNLPNRLLNAAENRTRWPGGFIGTHNLTVEEWQERFHTKNIPTAENKFAPENVSGWIDPRKDAILDELNSIVTAARSEQLQLEFLKMFSDTLPEWTNAARLARSAVLSFREQEFVLAAHCLGASRWRVMLRHLLPNSLAPLIVTATLDAGAAIRAETTLSFLGLGIQPPTPSWGNLLTNAATNIFIAPLQVFLPGLFIFFALMSFNLLGDALRDALDPRLAHVRR